MKKLIVSLGGALAVALIVVAGVAAAGPGRGPNGTGTGPGAGDAGGGAGGVDVVSAILKLTQEEIADLRADGLSLAQIAERQQVDPQKLVDALVAQWSSRIDVRVANGALTAAEATQLKAELAVRAKAMVFQATAGGMQGAAVGAGPGAMGRGRGAGPADGTGTGYGPGQARQGHGAGNGICDGTGPQAAPQS